MLRKAVTALTVILIAAWILSNPSQAGHDVHVWALGVFGFFQHVMKG